MEGGRRLFFFFFLRSLDSVFIVAKYVGKRGDMIDGDGAISSLLRVHE